MSRPMDGECWREVRPHTQQDGRMPLCAPFPRPALGASGARHGSHRARVCALGVGRGRMGRACLFLRLIQCLSQNGNFQNPLAPVPCSWRGPVPGGVCARGRVLPPAGGREIRPR